jgi:cytochrome P450
MHVEDFDVSSEEVAACPEPFFAALRRECPVWRDDQSGIYWIAKYDDVKTAARQPNRFSNHREVFGAGDPELEAIQATGFPVVPTITPSDPPEHSRYRKLIFRSFSKPFVESLEPSIADIVNSLIDKFVERGEVDFEHEFAALVPGYVIADALGVPREDQPLFMRWTDEITATIMYFERLTRAQELEYAQAFVDFQHYFAAKIEEKRANPTNDMISLLVHARVDDERPLDVPEILDIVRVIMLGGNETTAAWISGTMALLLDHPDVMARVRADRSLIPRMLEESLRLLSPSRWNRRTLEGGPYTLSGAEIPDAAIVRLVWNSANYDEKYYPDPDRFDIDRAGPTHLAFGHGVHFCVGKDLARTEARLAFEILFDRLDDIELAVPREQVHNRPMGGVPRLNQLPLRFRALAPVS